MNDQEPPTPPAAEPVTELQVLNGAVELTVTHLAADAFASLDESDRKRLEKFRPLLGTQAVVKVRQVLVSNMARYAFAVLNNQESVAIEIYCGKEVGWADTLTQESVNAVADKGLDINLDFLSAWLKRQAKLKKIQDPEWVEKLLKRLAELEQRMIANESASLRSSTQTPSTTG